MSTLITLLRLARHLLRQVPSQGAGYAWRMSRQARPLMAKHQQLVHLMSADPQLKALTRSQPGLLFKYLGPYLARHWSTAQRLAILYYHYQFVSQQASPHFFTQVWQKPVLWQDQVAENIYTIHLEFPIGIDFEGDLSLVFSRNQQPLYALSFTFMPASLVGGAQTQPAILISRVQGSGPFAGIQQATRQLQAITPAALLVIALQGLALAFQVEWLLGVSTRNQLYAASEEVQGHFFDYDGFWTSFGGQPAGYYYRLGLPLAEKPLAALKANHRRRTLGKRRYKHQLSQWVYQYSRQYLLR